MCDGGASAAAIAAYVGAAAAVAGTAYSVDASRKQAKHAEDVGDYNARVAENAAEDARSAGTEAENLHRRKVAALVSKQRAQSAASGVDVGSGSAFALQEDTALLGEADAMRIRANTDSQFASLKQGAVLTQNQAAASASAARASGVAAGIQGVGSATSSFADSGVADKWFTEDSAAVTQNPDVDLNRSSAYDFNNNPLINQ